MLDIIFYTMMVFIDRSYLFLVFLQLIFMIIFYGFHVFSVLEVNHQLVFDSFDNLFFVLQLFLQILLLSFIFLLIFSQLRDLHLGLQDQVFKVVSSVFEVVNLFLSFCVVAQEFLLPFFGLIQLFLLLTVDSRFIELHLRIFFLVFNLILQYCQSSPLLDIFVLFFESRLLFYHLFF